MTRKRHVNDLHRLRSNAGYSIEELATMLGVSASAYHGWEHGKSVPRNKYRPELARLLSISNDELYKILFPTRRPTRHPAVG